MEEINTAKMLNEETKMNQDEMNEMYNESDMDEDIEDEFAKLEAAMLENNLPDAEHHNTDHLKQSNSNKKEAMLN